MITLHEEMARLNERQLEAVQAIDGPLLVIAGPGTGKTQILGLRAANIVACRDVNPCNVLCLTYTEAGAEAMRSRLVEMCGRDGYGFEVCTFHGFAQLVRSRYPEYFSRPACFVPATDLQRKEIIDACLKDLPFGSPLSGSYGGVSTALGDVESLIANLKRNGVSPQEFKGMLERDLAAVEYLQSETALAGIASTTTPRAQAAKEAHVEAFEAEVRRALAEAPEGMVERRKEFSGIHIPYLAWLAETVRDTPLIDADGKVTGYNALVKSLFKGRKSDGLSFDAEAIEKGLAAAGVYARYQEEMASRRLYDFDDMVMDLVAAVEGSSKLRAALQSAYEYIQVDEFQDTNGAQMRIVNALCDGLEQPNVMAVGDDDQAIMRFQGATLECIEEFERNYKPKSVVLSVNYRSTPAVVGLGGQLAGQIERRLAASSANKAIVAHRGQEGPEAFAEHIFASPELEYHQLACDIRRQMDEGFLGRCGNPEKAIAVISAKHSGLRALIPYLVAQNVPFAYREIAELFGMDVMQSTLALIRCVSALSQGKLRDAEAELPRLLASEDLGGGHRGAVEFAIEARGNGKHGWLACMAESRDAFVRGLHGDIVSWAARAAAAPVRPLMHEIARRCLGYYGEHREADPLALAQYNAGIRAMLAFAADEMGCEAALGRTMTLVDVAGRLEAARKLGVRIDAAVDLGAESSVRLITAHGSKGLEYEQVYLLDADDRTWHSSRSAARMHGPNVKVGGEKDADDARRLAFVAVTRARTYLDAYRAGTETMRELQGLLEEDKVKAAPEDVAQAVATDWLRSYRLDTPELRALLLPKPAKYLSASSLNTFVKYEEGCPGGDNFTRERVLYLPQEPAIALDFGTIVHEYMENIVNGVAADNLDLAALASAYRAQAGAMDFDEADVHRYLQRFDRIADVFVPHLVKEVEGKRTRCEAKVSAVSSLGTPLFGSCDLLIIDDDAKDIRVVDYKTGQHYPDGEPEPGYKRQLQFYRLLVESSPEFAGYRVAHAENWYVEPDKDGNGLREPIVASVTDEEIGHLEQLAAAVWRRVSACDMDTGAFEKSAAYEKATLEQALEKNKQGREKVMQAAYEQWLIEN